MNRPTEPVWAMLHEAGLAQGSAPEAKLEAPWFVKVLLAFSGWLAAVFLLVSIGMGLRFVFENTAAATIFGGLMIGGAFAVLRGPRNEFLEHLALAVSLAGQALVVFAIVQYFDGNETVIWALLALLQVPLALVMPNFVHRVFSSFLAALAFAMAFSSWGWPQLAGGVILFLAAWCWLDEFRHPAWMGRMRAFGYGLVLALILLKGTALFGYGLTGWSARSRPAVQVGPWLGEVLIGLVVLYVVRLLLQRYGRTWPDRIAVAALSGTLLLCAVALKVQGLSIGMVLILLGFAGSNRVLQGLGILSLLFYISSYYYLLHATLLVKSLHLLGVGLVLLVLRRLMGKLLPAAMEAGHV